MTGIVERVVLSVFIGAIGYALHLELAEVRFRLNRQLALVERLERTVDRGLRSTAEVITYLYERQRRIEERNAYAEEEMPGASTPTVYRIPAED